MSFHSRTARSLAAVTVLSFVACQSVDGPTPRSLASFSPPLCRLTPLHTARNAYSSDQTTVADVVIWCPPASIGVGETTYLQAWANAAQAGRIRLGDPIAWSVGDQDLMSLSPISNDSIPGGNGGMVGVDFWATLRGLRKGTVTVSAASGDKSSAVTIMVGEPAASIAISRSGLTLDATTCEAKWLAVALHDASGNQLNGRRVRWTSSNPRVTYFFNAVGDRADGVWVAGVDSGTSTITASTGLISTSTEIPISGHQDASSCMD